jgi:hypothetical protein
MCRLPAEPMVSNSTGNKKAMTALQKKLVTTAMETAFPRTFRGKISEISSQEMGPNPTCAQNTVV